MTPIALRWLSDQGLTVKQEFIGPAGACDLVGVSLNTEHVAHRLSLRQSKAIGSVSRVRILMDIPDVDTRRTATKETLRRRFGLAPDDELVYRDVNQLVTDRFVVHTAKGKLQKINGWMPLHNRLVTVELKLSRIDEAMRQASANLIFSGESYVGFPMDVCDRIVANRSRWDRYFDAGVGLLAVGAGGCEILITSEGSSVMLDAAQQVYAVEKFWRTRLKDNAASMLQR